MESPGGHCLSRTTVPVEVRIPTDRVHDDTVEQHATDSRHHSPEGSERVGEPGIRWERGKQPVILGPRQREVHIGSESIGGKVHGHPARYGNPSSVASKPIRDIDQIGRAHV